VFFPTALLAHVAKQVHGLNIVVLSLVLTMVIIPMACTNANKLADTQYSHINEMTNLVDSKYP
jgi:hypothetical protein